MASQNISRESIGSARYFVAWNTAVRRHGTSSLVAMGPVPLRLSLETSLRPEDKMCWASVERVSVGLAEDCGTGSIALIRPKMRSRNRARRSRVARSS